MFLLRRGDARHIASLANRLIKVFWISDVMAAPREFLFTDLIHLTDSVPDGVKLEGIMSSLKSLDELDVIYAAGRRLRDENPRATFDEFRNLYREELKRNDVLLDAVVEDLIDAYYDEIEHGAEPLPPPDRGPFF
jgi:hypothetical protein